jgi:FkbM family methyltransferase
MKDAAKRFVRHVGKQLPWGIREALLEGICDRMTTAAALGRLASRMGITGVVAEGDCGTIRGIPGDGSVFPRYAAAGHYAAGTTRLFSEFFAGSSGTYLDIGANIGLTTIPVARNPDVRCHAFEPEPTNFAHLKENIDRNCRHGNVELHQLALLDRKGTLPLALDKNGNPGDHRLALQSEMGRSTIEVATAPLDDIVGDAAGPIGAKIDVQGAEPGVIAGGRNVLSRAGLVVLEFAPWHMRALGGDYRAVVDYLGQFDRLAIVDPESDETPVFASAREVSARLHEIARAGAGDALLYVDVIARR